MFAFRATKLHYQKLLKYTMRRIWNHCGGQRFIYSAGEFRTWCFEQYCSNPLSTTSTLAPHKMNAPLYWLLSILLECGTAGPKTKQCNTMQYNTIQYNTKHNNTIQYNRGWWRDFRSSPSNIVVFCFGKTGSFFLIVLVFSIFRTRKNKWIRFKIPSLVVISSFPFAFAFDVYLWLLT